MGSDIIWIGIDDTDSITGGCTTYLACALVNKLKSENIKIIGFPKLVRLNPNIPWKTRGNGAIAINIENSDYGKIRDIVEKIIQTHARFDDNKTNPGYVILDKKPTLEFYKKSVREIIKIQEVENLLKKLGAEYRGYKNKRGLIGATASIAWDSKLDKTYELISYREKSKWGTNRKVDSNSVKNMNEKFPSTFDNFDYENNHNRITPNSPCPVLYGIRGENYNDLIDASSSVKSEKVVDYLIFETNQGTDDHLQRKKINEIEPFQSVITKGTIVNNPYTIKGGHVIFKINDSSGEIDCAAYEPTKQFRNIIRELNIGDKIEVYGGVREKPLTINIEKIRAIFLKKILEKVENPICPKCEKHMKSIGYGQGYKCKKCGTKSNKPIIKEKKRKINVGFYEVPVCARRHLSKPLKRMKP